MSTYEKILVPLDGSKLAEVALPHAEALTKAFDAQLTLLGAVQIFKASDTFHPGQIDADDIAVRYLRQKADLLRGRQISVDTKVSVGDAPSIIVDYAHQDAVDLIVMATHGRSGVKRWVLGSTADRVVRSTEKPVWLVRAKGDRADIGDSLRFCRVIVPLDGSSAAEQVLSHVCEIASRLQLEIVLLHVITETTQVEVLGAEGDYHEVPVSDEVIGRLKENAGSYLKTVVDRLSAQGFSANSVIRIGSAADQIIDVAEEMDAALVAMTTHGRSGIERWAYGNVADKVLTAGTTSLLLTRAVKPAVS